MAYSYDCATRVITVPQADLTFLPNGDSPETSTTYQLDLNVFRLALKDFEDSEIGMTCPDTHRHATELTVAGTTFARVVEIINGWSVIFEDGQYAVILIGANTNLFDVAGGILERNQVQVIPSNSAGLISVESAVSGLTATESTYLTVIRKLLMNEMTTDPVTGKITILDDDDLTPLLEADIYEDTAESQPYRGQGIEKRKRLT